MATPPPEIMMAIIRSLTVDTLPNAYTFPLEVKATLHSLALVSYSCHEWSTPLLYGHVTVSQSQIAKLRATLSSATPRASTLAKRIHTLRLTAPYKNSYIQNHDLYNWAKCDMDVAEAAAVLHLLAPHATLRRLFMDMALTCQSLYRPYPSSESFNLQNAISSLTSLSDLVLGNLEETVNHFYWMIELDEHPYNCLSALETVTILDVNVVHAPTRGIFRQLTNVKEMVLIRPWMTVPELGGEVLAELFGPNRVLQSLTIILASGWDIMPLQSLRFEDLGPAMVPYRDKVLILPESEEQKKLFVWKMIRDKIGTGHRWDQQV
ncbi:hypothetical protein FRB95_013778 [Tulasnella sp. JGI-2019a]|nr:hypothetical protein FRB95_013778 [Tulasnella sp. JGI-2019a]